MVSLFTPLFFGWTISLTKYAVNATASCTYLLYSTETFTIGETPVSLTAWTLAALGVRLYIVQLSTSDASNSMDRHQQGKERQYVWLTAVTTPRVPTVAYVPAFCLFPIVVFSSNTSACVHYVYGMLIKQPSPTLFTNVEKQTNDYKQR